MMKSLAGLVAGAVVACTEPVPPPQLSEWPPGSKVVGQVCFERETEDGWVPAQLSTSDGRTPVKGAAVVGPAYFPMDAGQLRLTSCR